MAGFLQGSSLPLLLPPRLILGEFQEFPGVLQVHLPAPGLPRCLGDLPRGSTQPPYEFRQRNREKAARRARGDFRLTTLIKSTTCSLPVEPRAWPPLPSPPPLRKQRSGPRSQEAAGNASGARDDAKIGQEGPVPPSTLKLSLQNDSASSGTEKKKPFNTDPP